MRVQLKESIRMTDLILPRRGFLVGLASLLAAPAVVRAEALMPIKVWRPPLRWRDGYIVLNGAELKISEFPDLFDAFGHHYGGRGSTFRLPTSGGPPGHETLSSVDAAWHGFFYPAVVGPFAYPDTAKIFDGGWRWEDFFRGPGFTGLRKGTLTYGPPRRHVCKDGVISDDEWNRCNEARRAAILEANSTARR
jgi:hypothetical protein